MKITGSHYQHYQVRPQSRSDLKAGQTSKQGQGLLEVVLVLGVAVLVIVALVWVTTVSIRNADFAKKKSQAAKYSQEGMEKVRAYRDQHDWNSFGTNCGNLGALGLSQYPTPYFTLSVSCTDEDSRKKKVIVIISWTDSSGTHQSKQISYFTRW